MLLSIEWTGKTTVEMQTQVYLALIVNPLNYLYNGSPDMIYEDRGIDANKKVNERKRQLLPGLKAVNGGGRLWFAHVHAANLPDGAAGLACLVKLFASMNAWLKYMEIRLTMEFLQKKSKNTVLILRKQLNRNSQEVSYQLLSGMLLKLRWRTGTFA